MSAAAGKSSPASRLLVVDDDEGMLVLMAETLRAEGYEVATAATGRAALEWLDSHTPDLLVLDLKLSDLDAATIISRLDRGAARIPFIVVTGQGDERVAVDVMKRGALDYVMKETAMLDLLPTVVQRALDNVAREKALAAARAEQARLEAEVLAASERERHSIGADLHDGLGQLLTAVEFMCTALKEDTAQKEPQIAERLDQMGGLLREAVVQTRLLARGLVPLSTGPEALHQGLIALAERAVAMGRTHCDFEVGEVVEVADATAANHLYRIAQEAVTNAVKHARGSGIKLRLFRRSGRLVLEIEDDGVGLHAQNEGRGAGLGLMRYRASLIGADLAVKSGPSGRGVVVTCSWPQP